MSACPAPQVCDLDKVRLYGAYGDDSDSEGSQVLDPSSAQVPLPVPPPSAAMTPAASGSRGGRGAKRGASGDLSGAAKK